jgi:hypothetical protein
VKENRVNKKSSPSMCMRFFLAKKAKPLHNAKIKSYWWVIIADSNFFRNRRFLFLAPKTLMPLGL